MEQALRIDALIVNQPEPRLHTPYDMQLILPTLVKEGLNCYKFVAIHSGITYEVEMFTPLWFVHKYLDVTSAKVSGFHWDDQSSVFLRTAPKILDGGKCPLTMGEMLWVANTAVFQDVIHRNNGIFKMYWSASNFADITTFTIYSLDILPEGDGEVDMHFNFLPDMSEYTAEVASKIDRQSMDLVGERIYERVMKYFTNHRNSYDKIPNKGYAILHALLLYHHVKHPVWIDSLKNICLINIALLITAYCFPTAREGALQRHKDVLIPSSYEPLAQLVNGLCRGNIFRLLEDDN